MSVEGNANALNRITGKIVAIPQVDDTLSKEGFSADAKATGEKFKELEGIFKDYTKPDASKVEYDNNTSKLNAQDVQSAIDEVVAKAKKDLDNVAKTYLKLSGGTLSGALQVKHFENGFSTFDKNHSETNDYGTFLGDTSVDGKTAKITVSALLNLLTFTDANSEIRNIYHDGNKPFGSYDGNGDATARVVETNGIGRLALVYHGDHLSLVTPKGALKVTLADGSIAWVSNVSFVEGKFNISTTSDAINKAEETYHYQVI